MGDLSECYCCGGQFYWDDDTKFCFHCGVNLFKMAGGDEILRRQLIVKMLSEYNWGK